MLVINNIYFFVLIILYPHLIQNLKSEKFSKHTGQYYKKKPIPKYICLLDITVAEQKLS